MKIKNKKGIRIIIILFSSLFLAVGIFILFISPITKYFIEKYDKQWTGREITMDLAYVNPFTGFVYFKNLIIHEAEVDSIFFSAKGVNIKFNLWKLFSNTYEISELTLNKPHGIIIQNNEIFNFTDLIERFTPNNIDTTIAGFHFNILKLKVNDGEFHFRENQIPVNYFIKNVSFESTGKRWDTDTISGKFSFVSGIGNGDVKGKFTINLKNDDYSYDVVVHKYDLNIIEQYLQDLTNYGTFSANVDANINASGNFRDQRDVTIKGVIDVNDFHFGKSPDDDYVAFDKFSMSINDLSPLKGVYLFDSVSLNRPYFKYELYDNSDNIETMFGEKGANVSVVAADHNRFNLIIEIARYVKVIVRNFFQSYYKINRLVINNGDLKFNDYSLNELFSIDINPLNFIADSIDKNDNRVQAYLSASLQPFGNGTMALNINPNDTGDFDMKYHIQNIPAAMFNPYLIWYTSYPLDRGEIELSGTWKVRNGEIRSNNHLLVIDPRVTKRIKNKNTSWLPLPLAFSFVRDYGNVIDYEIPISGKLKDPNFHLKDVVSDILKNIFVKPVTTPYRMEVKKIEREIEKSLVFQWATNQKVLTSDQENFTEKMADFLKDNSEASILVHPIQYATKEKEYILFYEAKKKYILSLKKKGDIAFTESDSGKVNVLSIKDSSFMHYVNKHVGDTLLFTMQDKCRKLISATIVNTYFNELNLARKNAFILYFKNKGVQNRIKFAPVENTIPYNGFSVYKIEYQGELPESLTKAYEKLYDLNEQAPRKKYDRKRRDPKDLTKKIH